MNGCETHLVETHFTTVWLWKGLARNDLEQQHEFKTISEVIFNALNGSSCFTQMAVAPSSEGLWSIKSGLSVKVRFKTDNR